MNPEPDDWEMSPEGEGVIWQDLEFPEFKFFDLLPGIPLLPVPDVTDFPYSAICSIDTASWHLGSGALITPNLVLTAAHVIASGVAAAGATGEMRALRVAVAGTGESIAVSTGRYFTPSSGIEGQPDDFALLRLVGQSSNAPLRMARMGGPLPGSSVVEVSGYPTAETLMYSRGRVAGGQAEWLDYRLSTLPGQSGSPILHNGLVVGVHLLGPGFGDGGLVANRGLWLRSDVTSWINRLA